MLAIPHTVCLVLQLGIQLFSALARNRFEIHSMQIMGPAEMSVSKKYYHHHHLIELF